jgi:hypothetical protein
MARLMQVGERLHNHTIGLHEPLRVLRFCSAAPTPHAKPCHDTVRYLIGSSQSYDCGVSTTHLFRSAEQCEEWMERHPHGEPAGGIPDPTIIYDPSSSGMSPYNSPNFMK